MEYTKDLILNVSYGQAVKENKRKVRILEKISNTMSKHRLITAVVSITLMLMILDFMMLSSFVSILNGRI